MKKRTTKKKITVDHGTVVDMAGVVRVEPHKTKWRDDRMMLRIAQPSGMRGIAWISRGEARKLYKAIGRFVGKPGRRR